MGCSNAKEQSSPVVVQKPKGQPVPVQSAAPASAKAQRQSSAPTRWSPSPHISVSNGTARLKPSSVPWSSLWTNLRIPDSFELAISGQDTEKLVVGVTAASNRSKCDGVKLVKDCEVEVFSFEGVGLVHTEFSEYTYNSEQWRVKPGDVVKVEIAAGVTVTFYKNGRKLYTHEDVPDVPLLGFFSLASPATEVEVR